MTSWRPHINLPTWILMVTAGVAPNPKIHVLLVVWVSESSGTVEFGNCPTSDLDAEMMTGFCGCCRTCMSALLRAWEMMLWMWSRTSMDDDDPRITLELDGVSLCWSDVMPTVLDICSTVSAATRRMLMNLMYLHATQSFSLPVTSH